MTEFEVSPIPQPKSWRGLALTAVFVLTLISLAAVLIPVYLIWPYRVQTPRILELSYYLRLISPILSIVVAVPVLVFIARTWKARRWWTKGAMALSLLLALFCVWASRFNHFEMMFNHIKSPTYDSVAQAGFLTDGDMLMAVDLNGEAAAYPLRQIAYYHIVQDVVGGVPIVVTY